MFNTKCSYFMPKKDIKKLDPLSREALMIAYSSQSKGYKLWDTAAEKLIVSLDVTFDEFSNNYSYQDKSLYRRIFAEECVLHGRRSESGKSFEKFSFRDPSKCGVIYYM